MGALLMLSASGLSTLWGESSILSAILSGQMQRINCSSFHRSGHLLKSSSYRIIVILSEGQERASF